VRNGRYRPGYPPELIRQIAEAARLTQDSRVLDLGCGPGSLAIPLAAHAGGVVAVDAEPAMVDEVSRAAPANVRVVEARAEEVDDGWGAFDLVTAGRAFHWFDAQLVLANLARLTPVVALCGDDSRDSEAQSFVLGLAAELIDAPPRKGPSFRYSEVLATSAFSDVSVISVQVERTWTPDELIGFAYSTSSAAPERLGERQAEFERRVREEAKPSYRERTSVDAVIGRRVHPALG